MASSNGATGETGAAKPKSSLAALMIEIVAITAIAAGAGAGVAFLQGAPASTAAPSPAADKAAAAAEPVLVELPPIVTNIASPADLWIRIEAAIVIQGQVDTPSDVLAAEIATDALAYLRTLTIGQIEGPIGLANIRQDLTDRAIVRSKGKVSELILKTMVLQ